MKNRGAFSIIGIALMLICLFSFLPLQAQTDKKIVVRNLEFVGINPFYDLMIMSWDTIPREVYADLQVQGGGVFSTWTSVYISQMEREDSTTYIYFRDLSSSRTDAGNFSFRIKVAQDYGAFTPWAYVDEKGA